MRKYETTINEIEERPSRMWPLLKRIGRRTQPNAPVEEDGKWFFNDDEKAEKMASFLENQFTCPEQSEQKNTLRVEESCTKLKQLRMVDPDLTTQEEVETTIKQMSSKKAPGEENIPIRAVKLMGKEAIQKLVRIINAYLRTAIFPRIWKNALIVMLPKGDKDPTKPRNRRPISLLNNFGKIAERIIRNRLIRIVEGKEILPCSQFGFREQLGAVQQAASSVLRVVRNRRFSVKVNQAISTEKTATEGLPQGSSLSPVLFNLFVREQPDIMTDKDTKLFQFADDTALATNGRNAASCCKKMEENLKKIDEYTKRWKIKINQDKTEVVGFGNRRIYQKMENKNQPRQNRSGRVRQ
ncbi:Reverse transcriptase (RNA-dependent DNA polymerase) [Popillia japonica]|uniref:Reverse transcriptase (RNA-dependent DNA polymerase) n=1 Tax=Popillia japonica TaxID=7064 RepID=A0AAW1LUR7_POPJA